MQHAVPTAHSTLNLTHNKADLSTLSAESPLLNVGRSAFLHSAVSAALLSSSAGGNRYLLLNEGLSMQ